MSIRRIRKSRSWAQGCIAHTHIHIIRRALSPNLFLPMLSKRGDENHGLASSSCLVCATIWLRLLFSSLRALTNVFLTASAASRRVSCTTCCNAFVTRSNIPFKRLPTANRAWPTFCWMLTYEPEVIQCKLPANTFASPLASARLRRTASTAQPADSFRSNESSLSSDKLVRASSLLVRWPCFAYEPVASSRTLTISPICYFRNLISPSRSCA